MGIILVFNLIMAIPAFILVLNSRTYDSSQYNRVMHFIMLILLATNILVSTSYYITQQFIYPNQQLANIIESISIVITPIIGIGILWKTDRKRANSYETFIFILAAFIVLVYSLLFVFGLLFHQG